MTGGRTGWLAVLLLAGGLRAPARGGEGPDLDPGPPRVVTCPPSSYSPCHYYAPACYRWRAFHHPANIDSYPPGNCSPGPFGYRITPFPCPAVDPVTGYQAHPYGAPR